jgi:hypothetical protein
MARAPKKAGPADVSMAGQAAEVQAFSGVASRDLNVPYNHGRIHLDAHVKFNVNAAEKDAIDNHPMAHFVVVWDEQDEPEPAAES